MLFWARPSVNVFLMHKAYGAFFDLSALPSTLRATYKRYLSKEDKVARASYWRFLIMKHAAQITASPTSTSTHFKRLFRIGRLALTEQDLHDLEIVDERAFALQRSLKMLEVVTPLQKSETVFAKYPTAFLKIKQFDGALRTVARGELLLTNLRCLVVQGTVIKHSLSWRNAKVSYDGGLVQIMVGEVTYVLAIYDDLTLINTVRNLLARKVRYDY